MIAVIDYGAGNLQSVVKAFEFIGCDVCVTTDEKVLEQASAAVLPGVGSFGDSMKNLQASGFVQPVLNFIKSRKPFLGICLGLQLLFEASEESPGVAGLGVFEGTIQKIPETGLKIPHIGWNSLEHMKADGIFKDLPESPYVYFVHSYYLKAENRNIVTAQTQYGVEIDVAVQQENVFATQFHPEKSGETGLQILRNFAALAQ